MTEREETRTVAQIVGQNMRRIRESRGKVLHDVASAARELGLSWDASAVSRIETGKRELTLNEFMALPSVLNVALDAPPDETVTMVELLEIDYDRDPFLKMFDRETSVLPVYALLAQPWLTFVKAGLRNTAGKYAREWLDEEKRKVYVARAPDEDRHSYDRLRAAAADLGVTVGALMEAATALWDDMTMTFERERRLLASGEDLSNPTRVRTLRGHITRQLMAELRDYFASWEADRG